MKDEFTELENELRGRQPRTPSAECVDRICRAIPVPAGERVADDGRVPFGLRDWLLPLGLAAACIAAVLLWPDASADRGAAGGGPVASGLIPVAAENVLCGSLEEGLVSLANGETALRVRREYVDIYTWRDPRTNASLRWAVPREEVRVIPVSTY